MNPGRPSGSWLPTAGERSLEMPNSTCGRLPALGVLVNVGTVHWKEWCGMYMFMRRKREKKETKIHF